MVATKQTNNPSRYRNKNERRGGKASGGVSTFSYYG